MSVVTRTHLRSGPVDLQSGDRMTREEFHRAYEQTPEDFKAELIGGIVYVSSPLRLLHGTNHLPLGSVLWAYEGKTPGVQAGDNTTIILADDSEPQPDLFLRILPEYGGQSRTSPDDYVVGPPELVAEIAHSSRAIDLHSKRADYRRYGVLEYMVFLVAENRLRWFDLQKDSELSPDAQGVCRLHTFPGLWIDSFALIARDSDRLMASLNQGLATPEHADFVQRLARAKSSSIKA